jgi:hypothetical protein
MPKGDTRQSKKTSIKINCLQQNLPLSLFLFAMSLEHPFGISLYSYFDTAYEAVTGKPAGSFQYIQGQTPLSDNSTGMLDNQTFLTGIR